MNVCFQKPKSDAHRFVIYLDTEEGYIADKDEDGDIILYTREEAAAEVQESAIYDDRRFQVKEKSEYQEYYKVLHSVVDGTTKTIGMTPKQR